MRIAWLALAASMMAPEKARARSRTDTSWIPPPVPPPQRQSRRSTERDAAQTLTATRSPCGRHVVLVENGVVLIDGRRAHPSRGTVFILAPPSWRNDGDALAWVERSGSETQLVVLPKLSSGAEALAWPLPGAVGRDRVSWVGSNRVVIGPEPLQPRAVATWSE